MPRPTERQVRHDPEALALWTEMTRREAGGDRQSEEARKESIVNNVHDAPPTRPQGNSREAALRRLAKEASAGNEAAAAARRAVLAGGWPLADW